MMGVLPLVATALMLREGRSTGSKSALGKAAVFLGGVSVGALAMQRQ